ncbi:hypothetical protein YH30_66 [Pseudomonas phage YH30]|uniref:Uncharacterized protein n=1 Tax=Pseudomonas phage YH30 TaxID=1636189 RepID=A0A0E3XBU7_9CAUD|nr:hypothetical protein YH30_66 [Pseudomonas phage YH30]AKC04808.1 hypothetical protein YH30_66 [Pseudomonas phage YH30]
MAKKAKLKADWTPGKLGHAPVNGRYFFVNRETRMTHTWTMGQLPVPEGYEQVSEKEYDLFRAENRMMPKKKLMSHIKGVAPCSKDAEKKSGNVSKPAAKSKTRASSSTENPAPATSGKARIRVRAGAVVTGE